MSSVSAALVYSDSDSDDSDIADLFGTDMLSAYPYREPRVDAKQYQIEPPPMISSVLPSASCYQPRGGGSDSDWRVWDLRRLSSSSVDSFIEFSVSVAPSASEEYLLTLLRDVDYDLVEAKFNLIRPLINNSTHSLAAAAANSNSNSAGRVVWSGLALDNNSISKEKKASLVEEFSAARRSFAQSRVAAVRSEFLSAFELASSSVNCKSNSNKRPNGEEAGETNEFDELDSSSSSLDVDVNRLRDLIQSLIDHSADVNQRVSPAVLKTLSDALALKNTWLDRAKVLLNSMTKAREGVGIAEPRRLLQIADTEIPGVNSKEKKKLQNSVAKTVEWISQARAVFERSMGRPIDEPSPSAIAAPVEFISLDELKQLIRDCDRLCVGIHTAESSLFRFALDYCKRFAAIVAEKIQSAVNDKSAGDEESSDSDQIKRETRGATEKLINGINEKIELQELVVSKLSLPDAERMISQLQINAPFVKLSECELLKSEVAKCRDWLQQALEALKLIDDEECVNKVNNLLSQVNSLSISIPDAAGLRRSLETRQWINKIKSEENAARKQGENGISLERMRELRREAVKIGINGEMQKFAEFADRIAAAEELANRANSALSWKGRRLVLSEWREISDSMAAMAVEFPEFAKLDKVIKNTEEWIRGVESLLERASNSTQPPHSIDFEFLDSTMNRLAGKQIAAIEPDDKRISALRLLFNAGKLFNSESFAALKCTRTGNSGVTQTAREKIRVEKLAAMEKLRFLSEIYNRTNFDDSWRPQFRRWNLLDSAEFPSAEIFVSQLSRLQLKISERIDERLQEIEENRVRAKLALEGNEAIDLSELIELTAELRKIGDSEDSEPLKSLAKRTEFASDWLEEVRKLLPIRFGGAEDNLRKTRRKRENNKKPANGRNAKNKKTISKRENEENGDEGDNEAENNEENEQAMDESESELAENSDALEFNEIADHRSEPSLIELQNLLNKFDSNAAAEKLDLFQLDELAGLRKCVAECTKWQTEARTALAADSSDSSFSSVSGSMESLLARGKSLCVSLPEIIDIETQSWAKNWSGEVKAILNNSAPVELNAIIEMLQQVKDRYRDSYVPQVSRLDSSKEEVFEFEDEKDEEAEEAESSGGDESESAVAEESTKENTKKKKAAEKKTKKHSASSQQGEVAMEIVKQEKKEETDEKNGEESAADAEAEAEAEAADDESMADDSPPFSSSGFLQTYRLELFGLETRALTALKWIHRTRLLFERRLGSKATDLVVGKERKSFWQMFGNHEKRKENQIRKEREREREKQREANQFDDDNEGESVNQPKNSANSPVNDNARRSSRKAEPREADEPMKANDEEEAGDSLSGDESVSEDENKLYCYCQRHYREGELMIICDSCQLWFHAVCLNLTKQDVKRLGSTPFLCPECSVNSSVPFKFRDKLPTKKSRVRGPKLESVKQQLESADNSGVTCEEIRSVTKLVATAHEWADKIDNSLKANLIEPGMAESERARVKQAFKQELELLELRIKKRMAIPAENRERLKAAKEETGSGNDEEEEKPRKQQAAVNPPVKDKVVFAIRVSAAGEVALEIVSFEESTKNKKNRNSNAANENSNNNNTSSSGLGLGMNYADLKSDRHRRESSLKLRESESDEFSHYSRLALGIPIEISQRRLLDDRLRLNLCLEKADRWAINNSLVEPATIPIDKRKCETKELQIIQVELMRVKAADHLEKNGEANLIWPRFDFLVKKLVSWSEKVSATLELNNQFKDLVALADEHAIFFPALATPQSMELSKRVAAAYKWLPKERRAISKRFTHSALIQMMNERFLEVRGTATSFTRLIDAEISKADDWTQKLTAAIESKSEPDVFQRLIDRANKEKILVDEKDLETAGGFIELYCLCLAPYVDGELMIACDSCENWYHGRCVNLLDDKKASKIKKYKCPRCCRKEQAKYQFGQIANYHDKTDEEIAKLEAEKRMKAINGPNATKEIADAEKKEKKKLAAANSSSGEAKKSASGEAAKEKSSVSGSASKAAKAKKSAKEKKIKKKKEKKRKQKSESESNSESDSDSNSDSDSDSDSNSDSSNSNSDSSSSSSSSSDSSSPSESIAIKKKREKREKKKVKKPKALATPANATANNATASSSAIGVSSSSSGESSAKRLKGPRPLGAALFATVLYEQLHDRVPQDQSNVLWHLLSNYQDRTLDGRLQEEILEAVKLVVGEQILTSVIGVANLVYLQRLRERELEEMEETKKSTKRANEGSGESGKPTKKARHTMEPLEFFMKAMKKIPIPAAELEHLKDENALKLYYATKWQALTPDERAKFEKKSSDARRKAEEKKKVKTVKLPVVDTEKVKIKNKKSKSANINNAAVTPNNNSVNNNNMNINNNNAIESSSNANNSYPMWSAGPQGGLLLQSNPAFIQAFQQFQLQQMQANAAKFEELAKLQAESADSNEQSQAENAAAEIMKFQQFPFQANMMNMFPHFGMPFQHAAAAAVSAHFGAEEEQNQAAQMFPIQFAMLAQAHNQMQFAQMHAAAAQHSQTQAQNQLDQSNANAQANRSQIAQLEIEQIPMEQIPPNQTLDNGAIESQKSIVENGNSNQLNTAKSANEENAGVMDQQE